jgi:hyperosmotically inducible periplasmic protein
MNRNLLAFTFGALGAATTLVACDRSSGDEPATATPARQEQRVAQASRDPSPPTTATAPREALADTVITGKIKSAILGDANMAGADVSVNTDHGVVTLAGLVKTPEQTAIASAHAQRQDGVMRVDNHLTLARQ